MIDELLLEAVKKGYRVSFLPSFGIAPGRGMILIVVKTRDDSGRWETSKAVSLLEIQSAKIPLLQLRLKECIQELDDAIRVAV
jgi:hypothetical protein